MEALEKKVETLTKEREQIVETLAKLKADYELNVRNLDRIDGALFILKEQLEEAKPVEEVTTDK